MENQNAVRERSTSPSLATKSDCSSRSTTPNSSSTYEYSQESFVTFQHKVKALASEMGAVGLENVKRLPGGSFNRIISATLQGPKLGSEQPHDVGVILRIPRLSANEDLPGQELQDQSAVLNLVAAAGVPALSILAFDATCDNAIKSPYSLQTMVPGTRLDLVYSDMSLAEKMSITDDFVSLLAQMDKIRFPNSGRRVCSGPATNLIKRRLNDAKQPWERVEAQPFGVGLGIPKSETRVTSSLYDLLSEQLDSWLKYEQSKDLESIVTEPCMRLKAIAQEMADQGFFRDTQQANRSSEKEQSILYHWVLEPRNILVERSISAVPDEQISWRISGVIDWDEALCVHPVLARRPPVWLWDFSDDDTYPSSILRDYDGDVDLLPPELYEESGARISVEDLQLKRHFESAFASKLYSEYGQEKEQVYHDEAYGRGR